MKIIVLEEDDNSFLHIFLIHKGILSVLQLSKKLEEKLIYQVACATDKTFIGEQNCLNGKNYEICKNLCIDNTFSNFDIQEKLIKIDRIYLITFIKEITYSLIFRKSLLNNFRNVFKLKPFCESNFIIIHLESKLPQPIDLSWSNKCVCLVLERMHLDSLMSWLSTLGGAFSALGDYDPAFAKKAGVTSYKQMMIASRLRDMDLIARCWLYFALSLIQKRKFKVCTNYIF